MNSPITISACILTIIGLALFSILPSSLIESTAILPKAPISTPPITQTFGIGAVTDVYRSNRNYFINANTTNILSPSASMIISSDLLDTDSAFGINTWSLQLNIYNPTSIKLNAPALSQFVIDYSNGLLASQIFIVAANDGKLSNLVNSFIFVPPPLVAGDNFTIKVITNATGYEQSALFSLASFDGKPLWSASLDIKDELAKAPIVGWEFDLLGEGSGSTATFTQASGTFSYSSITPLFWSSAQPNTFSWVAYKNLPGTTEKSNISYQQPTGSAITSSTTSTTIPTSNTTTISTTTTSPQLVPFTGIVTSKSQPPPKGEMGIDKGTNTLRFTQNGIQFFREDGNITIGFPKLSIASLDVTLSTLALKNSTDIQYQLTGAGSSITYEVKNASNPYNRRILISGTLLSTGTIAIPLFNPNGLKPSICDSLPHKGFLLNGSAFTFPACTQQFFGSMGFDWSDIPGAAYDNATHIVSAIVQSSFVIDPLGLDGSGTGNVATGTSATCTLSTSNTNDVIIVPIDIFDTASHAFSSISSTSSLTFTQRGSTITQPNAGSTTLRVYYAVASSTLSSEVITVSTASATYITVNCFGISGANTGSNIFDNNAGLPATNKGHVNSVSATYSTSNANDFIYDVGGTDSVSANNVCIHNEGTCTDNSSPFTKIVGNGGGIAMSSGYQIVSSTQTSQTANVDTLNGVAYNFIVWADAVCRSGDACGATVTQGIAITTLTSGAPSATITITGCSPSNSTFTANGYTKHYTLGASCSVTLTNPTPGANSRYKFNISPHPTIGSSVSFSTCGSGTCSTYSNNTYYQLGQNYTATPQTPSTWDGNYIPATYGFAVSGTYLGVGSSKTDCQATVTGTSITYCVAHGGGFTYYDYNLAVSVRSPIGNSWIAQSPTSFTDTTGGNTHNFNFIQFVTTTSTVTTTTTSTTTSTSTITSTSIQNITTVQSNPWIGLILMFLVVGTGFAFMAVSRKRRLQRPS